MSTHQHHAQPRTRRSRHALPARWWPPVVLAASVAAVIPGDTVGGLLISAAVLVLLTAVGVARRTLGHASVHVNLILAEELTRRGPAPATHRDL